MLEHLQMSLTQFDVQTLLAHRVQVVLLEPELHAQLSEVINHVAFVLARDQNLQLPDVLPILQARVFVFELLSILLHLLARDHHAHERASEVAVQSVLIAHRRHVVSAVVRRSIHGQSVDRVKILGWENVRLVQENDVGLLEVLRVRHPPDLLRPLVVARVPANQFFVQPLPPVKVARHLPIETGHRLVEQCAFNGSLLSLEELFGLLDLLLAGHDG